MSITTWNCDICKVACFEDYQEAVHHETICKGPPSEEAAAGATATPRLASVAKAPTDQHHANGNTKSNTNTNTNTNTNKIIPNSGIPNNPMNQQGQPWSTPAVNSGHRNHYNAVQHHSAAVQHQQQQQQHPSMMHHRTHTRVPNPINIRKNPPATLQNQGHLRHINYQQQQQQHQYRHPVQNTVPQNVAVKSPTPVPAPAVPLKNISTRHPQQHQQQQQQQQQKRSQVPPSITFDHVSGRAVQTLWTCDICKEEDFERYDEALAHEKICTGKKDCVGPKSNGNKSSNSNESSSSSAPVRITIQTPLSPQKPPVNPALSIHIPSPIKEQIPLGSVKPLLGSCYSCDVCKRAYFLSFEEAVYHENLCERNRDRNVALALYQAANQKFIAEQSARNSRADIILKDGNGNGSDAQSIQARARGNEERSLDTGDAVKYVPSLVISPLTGAEAVSGRPEKKASPEIIEIEDDDTDLSESEHEKIREKETVKGTSLPLKKQILPPSPLRRPKTDAKTDISIAFRRTMDILLELDFRISKQNDDMLFTDVNLEKVFKLLAPFFRTALEQICLVASPDNEDVYIPSGYRLVEIKCKYCSQKKCIKDLSKWGIVLKTFAMYHLTEVCLHAPEKLKLNLKIQRETPQSSNDSYLSLDEFCDCVAMCYNFLDANKIDSRIRSGVFVKLDENDKKRKVINDSSPMRQKKINNVKSKVPDYNVKAAMLEHDLMVATNFPLGELVQYSKDGNSTNLIPFNGVPLLNSLSKRKTRSLRHCQKILLDNLEIYQGVSIGSPTSGPVYLRCQNCNSGVSKWEKKLSGKKDFYKQTMLAHVHFKSCGSTSEEVKEIISNVANTFSSSEGNPMREYCRFLVDVYGLEDLFCDQAGTVVIFSNSLYKFGEYSGQKLFLKLKSPAIGANRANENS